MSTIANMSDGELATVIANKKTSIGHLTEESFALERESRNRASRAWIAANGVTIDDVELSSGDGKEYFGVLPEFGKWLKDNSKRRWCEWNGRIHSTAEVILGRFGETPGDVCHIPGYKEA